MNGFSQVAERASAGASGGSWGPTPGGLPVVELVAFVVLSLLMVVTMVRFSRAWLARVERRVPALEPRALSPVLRWGLVYAAAWAALIAACLRLLAVLGDGSPRDLVLLAGVVAAFWAMHAVLLWFAAALIRSNGRSRAVVGRGRGAEAERAAHRAALEAASDPVPTARGAPPSSPPRPAPRTGAERLREAGRLARNVAFALVLIALAAAIPGVGRLDAWTDAHRAALLPLTLTLAAVGFALLMGGAIHMVLTAGRPAGAREINELLRRQHLLGHGPRIAHAARVRTPAFAVGASAHETITVAELKAAWRARAWQVSPRWRRIFAMFLGAVLMTFGLFGTLILVVPGPLKLLLAIVLLYATVRTVSAFRTAEKGGNV